MSSSATVQPGMPNPGQRVTEGPFNFGKYNMANINSPTPPGPPTLGTSGTDIMKSVMGVQALTSIGTAFSNSAAIRAQGKYQESVANVNANLAALTSKQVTQMGSIAASRRASEAEKESGGIRTATAAHGVDVQSASSSIERGSAETMGAIDELTIRNNAARQAMGYQIQGMEATAAGKFAGLQAEAGVEQTLLTGGLQAIEGPLATYEGYERWSRYFGETR